MPYRNIWIACALAATVAALNPPALAATPAVSDAWFRALPGKLPAAGYFKLINGGPAPLSLVGADSSACGMLMLHKTEQVGGMNHMTMIDSVEVPAGGTVSFAPGDYHLMCMDATTAMKPGAKVSVTLKFSDGRTLKSEFAVKTATGK